MAENSSEFTLKELFLKTASWSRFIISRWMIWLPISFLGALGGYFYARSTKPTYTALTSFVLSTESKGSNLAGLASQFGMDVGGGGNDIFSGDNIITLFKSRLLLQRALFKPLPGSKELLINHYCNIEMEKLKWNTTPRTSGAYPFPSNFNTLTPIQDSLVRTICEKITKTHLQVGKEDKKTSFYDVSTTSENEIFSLNLTNNLVEETTRFYIETKTLTSRQNLAMLQREADSLRSILSGSISSSAAVADRNFNSNSAYQVNRAPIQQFQARTTVLTAAYGEVIKNLEIAKITVQKETPLFQIIDRATYPLTMVKESKLKNAFIFAFVSGVLAIIVLMIRRVVSFQKPELINT